MMAMVDISTTTMTEEKKEEDVWVVNLEKEYESHYLPNCDLKLGERSIYRWPSGLERTSTLSMHRTPHVVSFGPYHHGAEHLQPMEHYKERAFYRMVNRSRVSLSSFVNCLKDVEQELRDSYDDLNPKLTSENFLKMMLFDGCFLLEMISVRVGSTTEPSIDPDFHRGGPVVDTVILRDMLLLENQIPILVLRKLFGIKEKREINDDSYLEKLLKECFGFGSLPIYEPNLHILDVYRKCLIRESEPNEQTTPSAEVPSNPVCTRLQSGFHAAGKKLKPVLLCIPILDFGFQRYRPTSNSRYVRSAARFHEAGVEFSKREGSGLRISFNEENGMLTLPSILVDEHTAAIYMNIMAFERMHRKLWRERKVISYVGFMDSLIDTAEDVNLLCSRGIMTNMLGSDEEAAMLFNKLGVGIAYCPDSKICDPLQKYAASGWNAARAYLKRKYFRNPWTALSLLAAIVLLDLTFIQALFAVLDFKRS